MPAELVSKLHHGVRSVIVLIIASVVVIGAGHAAEELPAVVSPEEFERLHEQLFEEADGQLWRQIPWTALVREALARAADEGKPILRWESHGPPLTCG